MLVFCGLYLPCLTSYLLCNTCVLCDWVDCIRSKASKDEMLLFMAICWSLWGNKNRIVHENHMMRWTQFFSYNILTQVQSHLGRLLRLSSLDHLALKLLDPPDDGKFKVNFDATVCHVTELVQVWGLSFATVGATWWLGDDGEFRLSPALKFEKPWQPLCSGIDERQATH